MPNSSGLTSKLAASALPSIPFIDDKGEEDSEEDVPLVLVERDRS
jgi:hypothetical protein